MGFGWARKGIKCICIKDSVVAINDLGFPKFKQGQIFTIAFLDHDSKYGVFLGFEELSPRHLGHIDGFRPLITLEDDISMFTALTNMSPIERLDRMKEMMDQ